MSRQSIVAPLGLITQPAKYGMYKRGALSTATNVVMRSPGVISSMPGVSLYRAGSASFADYVVRLMSPGSSSILVYNESTLAASREHTWVTSGATTSTSVNHFGYAGFAAPGRARIAQQRSRFYFTSWNTTLNGFYRQPIVYDAEGSATARVAGISPVAFNYENGRTTTNARVMEDDTAAAWRAVIRRKYADGYELISAPSVSVVRTSDPASGGPFDLLFSVGFPMMHGYAAGDIVELYRTRTVTPATTDPGDSMRLAVSQVITSGDITSGYVTVRDSCPDDSLGVELYANSGQEGAEASNFDPPASSDMCSFKGHMFYAATAVPAQANVGPQVAYGQLATDSDRIYGIGLRNTTGTTTSGSNVITAVVNMRGVVVGQKVLCGNFPGSSTTITGITATTITCLSNASASGAGVAITVQDVISTAVAPMVPSELSMFMGSSDTFFQFEADAQFSYGTGGCPFVITSSQSMGDVVSTAARGQAFVFRLPRVYAAGNFTLRATNGVNYSPPLPEISATANTYTPQVRENRLAWSKFQQPEHVPPLNFSFVGSGTLYRMIPTRDAIWLFCSDGLYRLSGDGGDGDSAWRIDLADPNLILAARNAVVSLKETVWAYTNRGLVALSVEGGIQEISLGVIGDIIPGAAFSDTWDTFMSVDQLHQEVWLSFRDSGTGITTTYIFNTLTKTFVKFTNDKYSAMEFVPYLQTVALGRVVTGAVPDVYTFNSDTSSSRMAGADVRYQPLFAKDPFDLKQFQDVTYIFEGVNAAATITPVFDDVDSTAFAVNQSSGESRSTAGVPRRCAIAPALRPGFKMSNVAAPWSFRGISARFTPGGEETERD